MAEGTCFVMSFDYHDRARFRIKYITGRHDVCWEWIGLRDGKGYGRFGVGAKMDGTVRKLRQAHRVMMAYGSIPADLCVLHKCDNPSCVNPRHLFLGTNFDNVCDRVSKNRSNRPIGDRNPSRMYPGIRKGELNGRAKMTVTTVRALRKDYTDTGLTFTELGSKYGITYVAARNIVKRRSWKHVK